MNKRPPVDDRVVIAWYNDQGEADHHIFDFWGLPLGSGARAARCREYARFKEALVGQGCEVHVWDTHCWSTMNYRGSFYNRKILGSKWRVR